MMTLFGYDAAIRLVDSRGNELLIEDFVEDHGEDGLTPYGRPPNIDFSKVADAIGRGYRDGSFGY